MMALNLAKVGPLYNRPCPDQILLAEVMPSSSFCDTTIRGGAVDGSMVGNRSSPIHESSLETEPWLDLSANLSEMLQGMSNCMTYIYYRPPAFRLERISTTWPPLCLVDTVRCPYLDLAAFGDFDAARIPCFLPSWRFSSYTDDLPVLLYVAWVQVSTFSSSGTLDSLSALSIEPDQVEHSGFRTPHQTRRFSTLPRTIAPEASPLPSRRPTKLPAKYNDFIVGSLLTHHEPSSYEEASQDPNWMQAIKEELHALQKNQTFNMFKYYNMFNKP